jgi:hypothetical protein
MSERARKLFETALELSGEERAELGLRLITSGETGATHPEEYVLLRGSHVVFHSTDQLEALARYADMIDEPCEEPLRFIAPTSPSRGVEAVVRGSTRRTSATSSSA